jgi:UDP-2-acetamido-3-amino-2,3-dideoxy-glucuronate N-acetyltransferase
MNETPRIAVVGAGYWGRNLLRNFQSLGALAGFAETREDARSEFGAQYPDIPAHESLDGLLNLAELDAIAIATPAESHGELVARALEAGKHVFVEKPLCLDVAEARRLGAAASERGLTLMVGHLLLYHPAFRALADVVAQGRLGDLRYIYSHRLSLGKIRRHENALWSFAPHDISMILRLVGGLPERVVANGGTYLSPEVADTTLSHMSFARGIQAHIFVSWLHPYKDHRLVVVGREAMAEFNDVKTGPEKLLLYPHSIGWEGNVPAVNKAEAEPLAYDGAEPLAVECAHFLNCVARGVQPDSDAAEGTRVLRVLDACHRSLAGGCAVNLGETRE